MLFGRDGVAEDRVVLKSQVWQFESWERGGGTTSLGAMAGEGRGKGACLPEASQARPTATGS